MQTKDIRKRVFGRTGLIRMPGQDQWRNFLYMNLRVEEHLWSIELGFFYIKSSLFSVETFGAFTHLLVEAINLNVSGVCPVLCIQLFLVSLNYT